MPATAGRVRMPTNNRLHSSEALRTTGIWANYLGDSHDSGKEKKLDDNASLPFLAHKTSLCSPISHHSPFLVASASLTNFVPGHRMSNSMRTKTHKRL